jgi:hypothetical protein
MAASTLQVVELASVYHHRDVYDALLRNAKLMEGPYSAAEAPRAATEARVRRVELAERKAI